MRFLPFLRGRDVDDGRNPGAAEAVLTGDVCYIRLHAEFRQKDIPLYRLLEESEMRVELQRATREILGPEFEVRSMAVGRGSIEIIALIGTSLYVMSRYKNFVESIELLVAQFRRVVLRFLGQYESEPSEVTTTWTPGSALTTAMVGTTKVYRWHSEPLLLIYVILSHAALLTALLWLVLEGQVGKP